MFAFIVEILRFSSCGTYTSSIIQILVFYVLVIVSYTFFGIFLYFPDDSIQLPIGLLYTASSRMDCYKYFLASLSSLFNDSVYSCGHSCSCLRFIQHTEIRAPRPKTNSPARASFTCSLSGNTRLKRCQVDTSKK